MTGRPISHWQREFETGVEGERCKVFAIRHPRERLHERIESRVDRMFEIGLIDEVRQLIADGCELSHTAAQAVGYREGIELLEGRLELTDAVERVKIRTRRFARHQETWFRGLSECRMIDLGENEPTEETIEKLIDLGQQADLEST